MSERLELSRDCPAIEIPAGHPVTLTKGSVVFLTQSLGGTYTVQVPSLGGLYRINSADGDAIGKATTAADERPATPTGGTGTAASAAALEAEVWQQLKTCYDPEIPVNIVDLGLVYDMRITDLGGGTHRVDVKMTVTAPGCGMGVHIADDARLKILQLPAVEEADVQVVWDPPWGPEMISPEGRQLLGME